MWGFSVSCRYIYIKIRIARGGSKSFSLPGFAPAEGGISIRVWWYGNRQQTVTRGNFLKRDSREHPLSVHTHGLRADAAASCSVEGRLMLMLMMLNLIKLGPAPGAAIPNCVIYSKYAPSSRRARTPAVYRVSCWHFPSLPPFLLLFCLFVFFP